MGCEYCKHCRVCEVTRDRYGVLTEPECELGYDMDDEDCEGFKFEEPYDYRDR